MKSMILCQICEMLISTASDYAQAGRMDTAAKLHGIATELIELAQGEE